MLFLMRMGSPWSGLDLVSPILCKEDGRQWLPSALACGPLLVELLGDAQRVRIELSNRMQGVVDLEDALDVCLRTLGSTGIGSRNGQDLR